MIDNTAKATEIIRNHILFSMGGSLIPVPIADTIAITGVQLDMIHQLSKLYQVNYRDTYGKTVLVSFVGNGLSRTWASLLKTIPVIGPIIGTVSLAVFSGAMTFAIGEVYLMHLEQGGTLLDFDWKRYEAYFRERFKEGLLRVGQFKSEETNDSSISDKEPSDPQLNQLQKLHELADLLAKGAISQEEYEEMKAKIKGKF